MADGKAKRMSGLNKKKQLIEVDGEKIIERTIRQLRALGIEPVLATRFEDFDYLDVAKIIPENNTHEIKKFNANKKYYENYDETLFIWGDTYFEDRDIKKIVETKVDKYKFFGSEYEIFGFKIRKSYYHLIDEASEYIIGRPDLDYGNTGSWGLLRRMGGHELLPSPNPVGGVTSIHEPDKYIAEGLLYILPGKSMDNDSMRDLVEFVRRFPNANVEELIYTKDNGDIYKFINGSWIQQN